MNELSGTEEKVLEIWLEVLNQSSVGLHEGFLELGGDSLSAMVCISRIRSTFGVEVPLEEFFLDQATVSDFARLIDRAQKEWIKSDSTI